MKTFLIRVWLWLVYGIVTDHRGHRVIHNPITFREFFLGLMKSRGASCDDAEIRYYHYLKEQHRSPKKYTE